MRTPSGWVCPTDGFYFRVQRGQVVGGPLLNPPEGFVEEVQAEQVPATKGEQPSEETFEEWLAKHGVTKEMYQDADDRTKEDLKTAFYQRHLREPDVALFPPQ